MAVPVEPEPARQAPAPQPVPMVSTVIAWPGGPGTAAPDNGRQGLSDAETEATSIIPAWQPPQAASARDTLALHTVPEAAAVAPAKLTFETGPFATRVVGLPGESASVGRAPDNDIVIGDPATSGHHCRVEVRNGSYWVSDLGSTNGTLVNGEPIIDKQLDHSDVLSIGQNTIRFTLRE